MRVLLAGAFAALVLAAAPAAPLRADEAADEAAIRTAMQALDAAFAAQDPTALRAMMTPDHLAVTFYYVGPQTVDQQIASLPQLRITARDRTEPEVEMIGPDAGLVTFEKAYTGTFEGNPMPSRVYTAATWVRTGEGWKERFYQETVVAD